MQKRFRRFAPALVAALAFAGLSLPLSGAGATSTFSLSRTFDGQNRYDTARKIAAGSGFSNVSNVVLATGQNFPDALAGNYLAAALGSPILLTARDTVPIETNSGLVAAGAKTVTVLGGTNAVSQQVENDLKGRGYTVTRVFGTTRYDTAYEVAKAGTTGGAVGTIGGKKTAFLATGENFADALAAGPASFAKKLPILLTTPGSLSPQAQKSITELGIEQVVVLGGNAAVSPTTASQADALPSVTSISRLAGADRTETATKIAQWAIDNASFSKAHINLARGDDFADALAGGPHGGRETAATLLAASPTQLDNPSKANATFLSGNSATLENGHIYGGTSAISAAVEAAAEAAGGAAPPEAAAGTSTPKVASVNTGEDYFVSTVNLTYYYDAGDTFEWKGQAITTPTAGMAGFESILNPDDVVSVVYDPNASGKSTFNLTDDVVHATEAPKVQVTNADGEADANDVRLTVTIPKNNSASTVYEVHRASYQLPACGAGQISDSSFAKVGDISDGDFVDPDVNDGCYQYRVVSRQPNGVTAASPRTGDVEVPGGSDAQSPQMTSSKATTDGGTAGVVSNGDVHVFTFDESMASTIDDAGSTYRVSDPDGSQADIVCGTTADCAYEEIPPIISGGPSTVYRLTVTFKAEPTAVSAGTTAGVSYPATIVSTGNAWKDAAGNPFTLAGDIQIEKAA